MTTFQFIRLQPCLDTSSKRVRLAGWFVAFAAASIATVCAAQTPPAALPPPPPAQGVILPSPPPGAPATPEAAAHAVGTLIRFTINPEGNVDGFLLADDTLVSLPPHLGVQLVALVRPGDRLSVEGWRTVKGDMKAQIVRNDGTGASLVDQPPVPGAGLLPPDVRGVRLIKLSVTGLVLRMTSAPLGEPDGVMLDNGTIVKLTPLGAQQFAALLKPGTQVAAVGYGTRNAYGEALQATAFGRPGNLVNLYGSAMP